MCLSSESLKVAQKHNGKYGITTNLAWMQVLIGIWEMEHFEATNMVLGCWLTNTAESRMSSTRSASSIPTAARCYLKVSQPSCAYLVRTEMFTAQDIMTAAGHSSDLWCSKQMTGALITLLHNSTLCCKHSWGSPLVIVFKVHDTASLFKGAGRKN